MILFKPEHVEPIIDGTKTETRRIWKRCRVRVGSEHLACTRPMWCKPPGKPFARLLILAHREELLGAIDEAGAIAEAYPDVATYLSAFLRINRINDTAGLFLNENVHVVKFRCLEDLRVREYPR